MWPSHVSKLSLPLIHTKYFRCTFSKCQYFSTNFSTNNADQPNQYDVAVVGGGIIGAASARELIGRYPGLRFVLLEKENELASHQSGRSSGVIHAGIYYAPGSLRARLCVEGLRKMYDFCEEYNLPHSRCGKLIVATETDELSRLETLYRRGIENNVPGLTMVDRKDIQSIEPYCQGLKAIHSPYTGIADYAAVAKQLAHLFQQQGGAVMCDFEVSGFKETPEGPTQTANEYPITIEDKKQGRVIQCRYAITCAGLYSDRVAMMTGCNREPKIVPFRGDYLLLKPEKEYLVKGNIYPVPNPKFPFLGFHFTPRCDGSVFLGPNAVFAFKREGYSPFDFNFKDFTEAALYGGTQKLILKNLSFAVKELYYGINLTATVHQLKRFVPQLQKSDVVRGPSGVRAQALSPEGSLVEDFIFDSGTGIFQDRLLHLRNAPSPAATASLAVSAHVADEAEKKFHLKSMTS